MGYRVTYNGDGIVSNELGVFQKYTTANTADEAIANRLASDQRWEVVDHTGARLGAKLVAVAAGGLGPPADAFAQPTIGDFAPPADEQPSEGKRKKKFD